MINKSKSKNKSKYTMPIKWCDSRISLKGKEVQTVYEHQYVCTNRKCKSINCITFQTTKQANQKRQNDN